MAQDVGSYFSDRKILREEKHSWFCVFYAPLYFTMCDNHIQFERIENFLSTEEKRSPSKYVYRRDTGIVICREKCGIFLRVALFSDRNKLYIVRKRKTSSIF